MFGRTDMFIVKNLFRIIAAIEQILIKLSLLPVCEKKKSYSQWGRAERNHCIKSNQIKASLICHLKKK